MKDRDTDAVNRLGTWMVLRLILIGALILTMVVMEFC